MKNKQKHIIMMVALLVIIGISAFFGGTKYQQRKSMKGFNRQDFAVQGRGQGMGQGMGQGTGASDATKNRGQTPGFRQTVGEIISADDKSITVKLADGSSKIILISDSTTINQSTAAAKTDLKVGTKVAVMGDQTTDGSVTGRNIEINPHVATVTPAVKQ